MIIRTVTLVCLLYLDPAVVLTFEELLVGDGIDAWAVQELSVDQDHSFKSDDYHIEI